MRLCEACGQRLDEAVDRCAGCGQPVAADDSESPSSPSSPDWDPDATARFTLNWPSHNKLKNTAALVMLTVALVAAVVSLAWLIGQTVATGRPASDSTPTTSASSTPLSTALPRNTTVCTPEVARSATTNCTLARRVLSAVRTLGTDLPATFRVTVTDPQTKKNTTLVCTVKGLIECSGGDEVTVYLRR
ncbi:hypothetical protein [Micropruina sp.]|uniref:hypothetical protein n=1 Tax=Micropruina sp. TaxID=2737536 RepID=UPI0039E37FC6